MNWIDRLNKSIDYIENNLDKNIDISAAAKIADRSSYHYQRLFSLLAEITLGEYIRSRRLTVAAYELQNSGISVMDVSLKYGYSSPTAFTRAFYRFHGVTPREARKQETKLQIYSKMEKASKQRYSWNIVTKEETRLAGVSDNKDEWQHSVMIVSSRSLQSDSREYQLPGHTWAIIECRGKVPQAIRNGWRYLKEEWMLRHSFQYGECPAAEWYGEGNPKDENYVSQIWIPINI